MGTLVNSKDPDEMGHNAFENILIYLKNNKKLIIANNIFDGQNDDHGTQK